MSPILYDLDIFIRLVKHCVHINIFVTTWSWCHQYSMILTYLSGLSVIVHISTSLLPPGLDVTNTLRSWHIYQACQSLCTYQHLYYHLVLMSPILYDLDIFIRLVSHCAHINIFVTTWSWCHQYSTILTYLSGLSVIVHISTSLLPPGRDVTNTLWSWHIYQACQTLCTYLHLCYHLVLMSPILYDLDVFIRLVSHCAHINIFVTTWSWCHQYSMILTYLSGLSNIVYISTSLLPPGLDVTNTVWSWRIYQACQTLCTYQHLCYHLVLMSPILYDLDVFIRLVKHCAHINIFVTTWSWCHQYCMILTYLSGMSNIVYISTSLLPPGLDVTNNV